MYRSLFCESKFKRSCLKHTPKGCGILFQITNHLSFVSPNNLEPRRGNTIEGNRGGAKVCYIFTAPSFLNYDIRFFPPDCLSPGFLLENGQSVQNSGLIERILYLPNHIATHLLYFRLFSLSLQDIEYLSDLPKHQPRPQTSIFAPSSYSHMASGIVTVRKLVILVYISCDLAVLTDETHVLHQSVFAHICLTLRSGPVPPVPL